MRGWAWAFVQVLGVQVLGMLSLALTASEAAAAVDPDARPDLALCPRLAPLEEPLNDRTKPLPVPAQHAMIMTSNRDRYAVSTIYGGTVCLDTRGMTKAHTFTISSDRRFLEFDWTGYEADGHIVVDRTGKGQVIETGISPISSPSHRRFAAIQQSEAGFGGLEGFGVWQLGVVGVRRLSFQQDIPSLFDWRIDDWAGDDCINLSGIPYDRIPDPGARISRLPRDRYVAMMLGDGWVVTPSSTGCPAAKSGK